ncbi:MAG: ammonium transporter [Gammaproteobacteria bacterium]|nr:ammonium transporter [Gammaproteobacteria bacterium]
MKAAFLRLVGMIALSALSTTAVAAEPSAGDTAWMLTATALVLFMTIPGLSLFYAGLVRSRNVLSILMQCFAITCMASLVWVIFGYSVALNPAVPEAGKWLGSLDKVFLQGVNAASLHGSIPETVWIMFQMTFAIITPALIVGGFAERMKFSAMMLFSFLWLIVVYLPSCYWVWGGGWLMQKGLIDFAGGTVVHINAGVAALVTALYLGKRKGFPSVAMPPHNLTMTVTGAGMLWVGWFGFNAGSATAAGSAAGMAMLATHVSAAAGALAWMSIEWIRYGKPSVLGIVTGMVAGLGTITPASGSVGPMGALIIGLSAGVVCYFSTQFIKRTLNIDDSLDVFPVHGVGGMLGTLLVGVFAYTLGGSGTLQPGETAGQAILHQLGVQFTGVVVHIVWAAVMSYILLKVVDMLVGVRVSGEEETEGLDYTLHGEVGYHDL